MTGDHRWHSKEEIDRDIKSLENSMREARDQMMLGRTHDQPDAIKKLGKCMDRFDKKYFREVR
jgi:adenylosuccinate lyase